MNWRLNRLGGCVGCLLACSAWSHAAWGAPRVDQLSLRGLQAGGITRLVIEGADLLPEPRILLSAPQASHKILEGATPNRLEVEFTIEGACPSGLYLLRVASASGISEPVAVGVDNLAQIPFTAELPTLNVALTGALAGSTVLTTSFSGKQGQQVLVEVESRRLGSKLRPVVHVYDARHAQLAFSRGLPSIAGDARTAVTLPADGTYTLELHDVLFRGAGSGFFRLKIGDFRYADMVYPLAVRQGEAATFEFAATNLPADARASGSLATADGLARSFAPAPWPPGIAMLSGTRPVVRVGDHPEVLEAPPADAPQEVPAPPVAINGRIAAKDEQDRYRLAVKPGDNLRFDVLARRAGSPLDGVLSIQNEQGAELAANDDRPGTSDPGLDFKVPEGVTAVMVVVRDLLGTGSADHIYRVSIEPVAGADFALSVPTDRVLVPKDGVALVPVKVDRRGYNGPIALSLPDLPPGVVIAGETVPDRAAEAFVTLSAAGLPPAQALVRVLGTSAGETPIKRRASLPESTPLVQQPWLAGELAVAVTTPAPLALDWEPFSGADELAMGTAMPTRLSVRRAEGVKGAVRLKLLTTQQTPRKKINENNQEREVDDVERTLRFEAEPTIAAEAAEAAANVLVPGDLPKMPYDLAIRAELLGEDNKTVVASVVTPARRVVPVPPLALALSTDAVAARAGNGPTGKVIGTIRRATGFSLPVNITLEGLPQELKAPTVTLTGDASTFEFPLTFPFGTAAGELRDVKVTATSLTNVKDPKSVFRAGELPLAVVVVPGEKPAETEPAAVAPQ